MIDTINALVELQRIDDDVREFKVQRADIVANLDSLRGILARMEEELADKREKLTEANRFYTEKQHDLATDSERIAKAKQKLAAVTRTKEYAAVQRELDNLRKKHADDENELRQLSQAMEEYRTAIASEEQKLSDLQAEVKREEADSDDRLTELTTTIDDIETQKKDVRSTLPANLHSRYLRVLGRREAKAVVSAIGGKCGGCQMRLPPQTYIMVQRAESIHTCPNCQRFLYFAPEAPAPAEEEEVVAPKAEAPVEVAPEAAPAA